MKSYIYINNRVIFLVFTIVLSVIIIGACSDQSSAYKPRAIGSPGEVLVVVDDKCWNSEAGFVLQQVLEDEFPALPQSERIFRKTRIGYDQFQRHFRTYRNILLISIRENELTNRVEYRKNEWAQKQCVAEVIVKSSDDMEKLLAQKWPKIKGFFYNGDINAMAQSYLELYEQETVDHVKQMYPFSLYFPRGFHLKKQHGQFTWIDAQRLGSQLGVFIYQYPLDSISDNSSRSLLRFRNNILRKEVPGEVSGSFMTTEEQYPVSVRQTKFGGKQWTELRGLWKVQGDFMGGPFIDYYYKDKENNQLVMLSAYVYAPAKPDKAMYMREVEAVLKTFRIN